LPGLRQEFRGSRKFYSRGITLYPENEIFREAAFISYYFHWSHEEVMGLDHRTRRRWCEEISAINQSINPSDKKKEKSIIELGKSIRQRRA
jgi:hypothetical protein